MAGHGPLQPRLKVLRRQVHRLTRHVALAAHVAHPVNPLVIVHLLWQGAKGCRHRQRVIRNVDVVNLEKDDKDAESQNNQHTDEKSNIILKRLVFPDL